MNNQLQQQKETNIKQMLASKTKMIQSIIGDKKRADKFTATALQVALNPDLENCTEESIINCLVGAAMLDLSPDKNVGQAYIYKYGNVATLQIGYKGWLTLLYRSGYEIRTFPVFECDHFDVNFNGWEMDYKLTPNFNERDIGNFEWEFENLKGIVVASKDLSTGEIKRDFIPQKVIEKMRKSSPNQKGDKPTNIWQSWYLDMCAKSAIKKYKNQLALRDENTNIAIANTLEDNKNVDFEQTKNKGMIIEAKEVQKEPATKSLNDMHKKTSSEDIARSKLQMQGIPTEDIEKFISNNKDRMDELVKDDDVFNNAVMDDLL